MSFAGPSSATSSVGRSSSSESSSGRNSLSSPGIPALSDAAEASGSRSTNTTPPHLNTDLPRPARTAGRGGCWTCRVRRKKCDEQRQGDSCQTCLRLGLECAGWGARRPDWMRDKQAVEAYKADIKRQLTSRGLIRGQPRSSVPRTPPSTSSSPSHQQYAALPGVAGPGPNAFVAQPQRMDPMPNYEWNYPTPGPSNASPISVYSDHLFASTTPPFVDNLVLHPQTPYNRSVDSSPFHAPDLVAPYNPISPPPQLSGYPYDAHLQQQMSPQPFDQNAVNQQHVLYYFENIRSTQYIFAGQSVVDAIHELIVQEPTGPVTNAVCALASLHHTRLRRDIPAATDVDSERVTVRYHEQATNQLAASRQLRGQYSEQDAVAAIQLISFSLFSAGSTDWRPMLDIACDWLSQTGLIMDENPRLTLHNMSAIARFAAKATMWYDIFASITDLQPPRYLALYQRLFTGGAGFWARSRDATDDQFDLTLESLTGCPDEVMLAIAETSALAHWKAVEMHSGSLSVRELIRRGEAIDQQLRSQFEPAPDSGGLDQGSSAGHMSLPHPPATPAAPTFPPEDMRRVVAEMYREAVKLYLNTVLSDSRPEIVTSVATIMTLLGQLPPSELDRSLLFPLCFAGALTDDRTQRVWIKSRLDGHKDNVGHVVQLRSLLDQVWQRRDTGGGVVDWRDVMRQRRWKLLLV